jgi:hypothetical protein
MLQLYFYPFSSKPFFTVFSPDVFMVSGMWKQQQQQQQTSFCRQCANIKCHNLAVSDTRLAEFAAKI